MSLVARHNTTSKNGNTLYIHEPNRRTLEGYVSPNVKVVPICVDCPTFHDDGSAAPADLQFELFDPIQRTRQQLPVDQVAGMMDLHAGKPLECRRGDIVIILNPKDRGVRVKSF